MRQFFDDILSFIVTTSLTNQEFESCTSTVPIYAQSTYDDLSRVLDSRGGSATVFQDRLKNYFLARGANIEPAKTGKSNIFIGGALN